MSEVERNGEKGPGEKRSSVEEDQLQGGSRRCEAELRQDGASRGCGMAGQGAARQGRWWLSARGRGRWERKRQ